MTPASASGAASPNGSCSAKSIAQCWQSGEITFWPGDGEAMPAADVLVEERRQKKQEAMVIARNGRGKSLQTSRSIAQRLHSDGTSTHTHTHYIPVIDSNSMLDADTASSGPACGHPGTYRRGVGSQSTSIHQVTHP